MINKDSRDKKDNKDKADDTTAVDVSAHIVIKDTKTGKIIVNKRG